MPERSTDGALVLLVDDDPHFLLSSGVALRSAGISPVATIEDSRQVIPFLEGRPAAAVVIDLSMPNLSGRELLLLLRERHPELPVIVMTGRNEVEIAVECMKSGAFDYLVKPVEAARFVSSIRRAREVRALREEVDSLKAHFLSGKVRNESAFAEIITGSRKMVAAFQYIEAIAASRHPVLLTGETGTGKELFSRAIHLLSGCKGELVPVNVAGLEDAMFSDTLFGHRKGAYTGADHAREGLISRAAGGTLFLDEIGDLSETSQVKLLRLIEDRKYYPLGSDVAKDSDARVVCATHRPVESIMRKGGFRRDLYYRLSAHHVHLPPLRDRKEDIPLLVDAFLDEAAKSEGKRRPTPPAELYTLLSTYDFPGNVRELRMLLFDAVLRHKGGILSLDSFRAATGAGSAAAPVEASGTAPADAGSSGAYASLSRLPSLKEAEDQLVAEALRRARNNQGIAASLLGITRQALNKRLVREARSQGRTEDAPGE
ncbi:MAG: sigma-54-dependent Fis family transcriptional regulator [Deltaproteobacteria bacterium]|nr:MAG: sigma-54-dependent Fis family transcriptional regulator [Deltaproteobacteria bacterium]